LKFETRGAICVLERFELPFPIFVVWVLSVT
jgi:hypothetical protein